MKKTTKKMKFYFYKINYYYDGKGSALVEAKNKKEAEEKYHNGNIIDDKDNSENYCIDTINRID